MAAFRSTLAQRVWLSLNNDVYKPLMRALDPLWGRQWGHCDWCQATNLAGTYSATALTLTVTATGALTVDSGTPAVGESILLAGQSTGAQSGLYTLTTAGSSGVHPVLTRRSDANTSGGFDNPKSTAIRKGTTYAGQVFTCTFSGTFTLDASTPTFTLLSSGLTSPLAVNAGGTGAATAAGALTNLLSAPANSWTLTYSTALRTVTALTVDTITDNSGGSGLVTLGLGAVTLAACNQGTLVSMSSSVDAITDNSGGSGVVTLGLGSVTLAACNQGTLTSIGSGVGTLTDSTTGAVSLVLAAVTSISAGSGSVSACADLTTANNAIVALRNAVASLAAQLANVKLYAAAVADVNAALLANGKNISILAGEIIKIKANGAGLSDVNTALTAIGKNVSILAGEETKGTADSLRLLKHAAATVADLKTMGLLAS